MANNLVADAVLYYNDNNNKHCFMVTIGRPK